MDDKSTLFAALVCALAIVVVLIAEHRPSFFWWRYLFGLEKTSPDEMEWNEVLQRNALNGPLNANLAPRSFPTASTLSTTKKNTLAATCVRN